MIQDGETFMNTFNK